MADRLTKEKRSQNMAAIKGRDTKPELLVRKFLHRKGYRYSLHRKDLSGKPDIVLRKHRAVVFVNGCYWHRHAGCKFLYKPKSNIDFWMEKFANNVKRDKRNYKDLEQKGWHVIIIWECELKSNEYQEKLLGLLKG